MKLANGVYLLVTVLVAAFVGGITNHLAIKMLFHPRKPLKIGKFRVPFTPGLIPKRREEIARSLGEVVSEYLVTSEGLQEMVLRPSFQLKVENKLKSILDLAAGNETKLEDLAISWIGDEAWPKVKDRLIEMGHMAASRAARTWWEQGGWSEKKLSEIVPGWSEELRQRLGRAAAGALFQAVEEELLSAQGQRMLTKMASGMLDQAGGFLGTMAAIFVDEDKLVRKMTPSLIAGLRSEETQEKVVKVIEERLNGIGEKSLASLFALMTDVSAESWIQEKVPNLLPMHKWMEQIAELKISDCIEPWKATLQQHIPLITSRIMSLAVRFIPTAMESIELPKLVQEQVEKFPIERLEEVILSVSGREFRAITWLGVLLGGIIGLLQSLMYIWFG